VMHGEYGMSETRELVSRQGQPLFERNSRDTFYMTSVYSSLSDFSCDCHLKSLGDLYLCKW